MVLTPVDMWITTFLAPNPGKLQTCELLAVCGLGRSTDNLSFAQAEISTTRIAKSTRLWGFHTALSPGCGFSDLGALVPLIVLDAGADFRHLVVDRALFGHQLADFVVGVHDRGVVTATEKLADLGK